MDYFWAEDKVRKTFRGLLIHTNNFCFMNIALFLLYLQSSFFLRTDGQTGGRTDKGTYRSSPRSLKITILYGALFDDCIVAVLTV